MPSTPMQNIYFYIHVGRGMCSKLLTLTTNCLQTSHHTFIYDRSNRLERICHLHMMTQLKQEDAKDSCRVKEL